MLGIKWWTGALIATMLAVLVSYAIRDDNLASGAAAGDKAQASVAAIGKLLVENWVVPLEAMAVLLTAALIGAVVIALEEIRKRQ